MKKLKKTKICVINEKACVLVLLFSFLFTFSLYSQPTTVKKGVDLKEELDKKQQRAYQRAVKHYRKHLYSIQSKSTKRMMKKNARSARMVRNKKNGTFTKRMKLKMKVRIHKIKSKLKIRKHGRPG